METTMNETRVLEISSDLNIVVAYCDDAKMQHESGWYVVRCYNPKTLEWVDYSRPGWGETYWINIDIANKYGLLGGN